MIDHAELIDEVLAILEKGYKLEDVRKAKKSNNYQLISGYIHDLYMILDICNIKKKIAEEKTRSSRLDIEHLLYASNAQVFVTDDEMLRWRARNIFKVLGKKIECPSYNL